MDTVVDTTPPPAPAAAPSARAVAATTVSPVFSAPSEDLLTPAPSQGVPFTAPSDVASLVARARAAQPAWEAIPIAKRIRAIQKVKDRVLDRAVDVGALVHRETGKPESEAILSEVLPSADVVDHWTRCIEDLLVSSEVDIDSKSYPSKTGWIYRDARGTVGLITPWKYPVALPLRTLVPALLAGNTVVFKPSEVTPGCGKLIEELFAGLLPDDVVLVAHGGGDVGQALAEADVDMVVFVGGVATGKSVAKACAERVSPCSLELGGKDAAIVLKDANLERAANGVVWGALTNAGQNCGAVERVYVEKSVADAFIERVKVEVASLRVGIDVGPMTTARQADIVERQVADAVTRGAKLEAGTGKADAQRYLAPVVIRVDSDESTLQQEETFGPVIPIAIVNDVDEAVTRANASKYGLTASVWTKDLDKGEAIANRLRVGVVTINNHSFTGAIPGAPWGGQGLTGYGVTGSHFALEALTRPRFVLTDASNAARELWWYPYTPGLRQVAVSMARFRSRTTGVFGKLGALFALVGGFLKRFAK